MKKESQKAVLQWLNRMEETAVNGRLKTRLLDAVRDYKKEMQSNLTREEWTVKNQELDELLGQFKKYMSYEPEEQKLTDEIRQRVSEMMERCGRSNEILEKDYVNGSHTYIEEVERSMKELFNVQANYDDVTNRERFLSVMDNIGQKYKNQIDKLQEKYVDDLQQNYQNAFDRLKGLFTSADYGDEIQRKFYQTYYENQDALIREARGYAQNQEKGQKSIREYAEKVQDLIQKITGHLKKKAAVKKWLPVLVVLLVVALGITGRVVSQRSDAAAGQENLEVQEEAAAETEDMNEIQDAVIELIDRGMDRTVDAAVDAAEGKIMGAVISTVLMIGIPIVLILIVLYWLWIKNVDKRFRNNVIEETEKLQRTAFEEWKLQGDLLSAIEESFRNIKTYTDKRYGDLLSQLLDDQKETDPGKAEFARLCSDWENIKRKVEF